MTSCYVDTKSGLVSEKQRIRNVIGIYKTKDNVIQINENIYSETVEYIDETGKKQSKRKYTDEELAELGYVKVVLDDKYLDYCSQDFNEDLTFNVDKYNARKQRENKVGYENLIVSEIRKKYNVNQELAILRQRDSKPDEYSEYNDYVESCKANVKAKMLLDE